MFTVETNMGSKVYQPLHETEVADRAIYFFLSVLDKMRPSESAKLLHNGVVMARKTPKGHYLHPDWR